MDFSKLLHRLCEHDDDAWYKLRYFEEEDLILYTLTCFDKYLNPELGAILQSHLFLYDKSTREHKVNELSKRSKIASEF